MKTLELSTVKIGDTIKSSNGLYYHIVQSIGKKKECGSGTVVIPVKTKCFSNSGRFVQPEKIYFASHDGSNFTVAHIN